MRELLPLNRSWKYAPSFRQEYTEKTYGEQFFETVNLPHTACEIPYNYANADKCGFVCCYRKTLFLENHYRGKRISLVFGAAAHYAEVYVNGKKAGGHKGGYTAFEIDISNFAAFGEENSIAVMLDTRERNDIPPFGYITDFLTYGGLYREVQVKITEPAYVEDVFVYSRKVLEQDAKVVVKIKISPKTENALCRVTLGESFAEAKTGQENPLVFVFPARDLQRWDLENPCLHTAEVCLYKGGVQIDSVKERFGIREVSFKKDGFYLNGKKIKLIGLNRHQSYAYAGYAMPKRQQEADADLLKNKLAVNLVRTSHYPQSKHFINRCDELGLLVFTEIPGWQHIGDAEWKQTALENTREMVSQYRNHPSIILWGVRINESPDCGELYTVTNALARELDPTRQTGGVRCIKHSALLEDVYTYNDFIHDGTNRALEKPRKVCGKNAPYLVSEHNGHMFPIKRFDCEARRRDQALRHAAVMQEAFRSKRTCGAIGWCMSDYNTHGEFGSGDGICYHGVTDMFRIPKFAAAVYASQQENEPILEISSTMNLGDHSALILGQVVAFSNADSIRLYKNGEFINEFFPDKKNYPFMPHPPFFLDDLFGNQLITREFLKPKTAADLKDILIAVNRGNSGKLPFKYVVKMIKLMLFGGITRKNAQDLYAKYAGNWGMKQFQYRFEAVSNGKIVKTVIREPLREVRLRITADTAELIESETYDTGRIVIEACDQNGMLLPYYQEAIYLEVSGPIKLLGPPIISLKGGAAAVYIQSAGKGGTATLSVTDCTGKTCDLVFECSVQKQGVH